jgi:REP element-mobilizing transposase RayT
MSRAPKRHRLFADADDFAAFLDLIDEAVRRYDLRVHGYTLMPNHYHLLLESVHGSLSRAMAYVNARYAQHVHRRNGSGTPVFRGRFHNRLVVDPAHWRHLPCYLHLNPVRARLVLRADQWRWSSQREYRGQRLAPNWLSIDELLGEYGGHSGYARYFGETLRGRREPPDGFESVAFGSRRSSSGIVAVAEVPRLRGSSQAIEEVLSVTGLAIAGLMQPKRGRGGNPARTLAAWWLVFGAGQTNVATGRALDMSPVAVTRALERVRTELASRPSGDIYRWVHELEDLPK